VKSPTVLPADRLQVLGHQRLRRDRHAQPGHRRFQQVIQMLESLAVIQRFRVQPCCSAQVGQACGREVVCSTASPARPGRRAAAFEAGEVRAQHRADTLLGQHMHLHVRRPRRLGNTSKRIQPGRRGSRSPSPADRCRRSSGRSAFKRPSAG
jgi:hypothetical protein